MTPICFFCKYFEEQFNSLGHRDVAKCKLTQQFTHENNICDSYTPASQQDLDFEPYSDEYYENFGY